MVKQRSNCFNGTTNCPIVAFQGKKMQRTLVEGLAAHQLALRNKNNRFYTNHLPMDFEFAPSSEISCHDVFLVWVNSGEDACIMNGC